MSNLTPLNTLAARLKALETTVGALKNEYAQWLEVAQDFEHALSQTIDKLDCASDDLESIGIDPPLGEDLTALAPAGAVFPRSKVESPPYPVAQGFAPPDLDDEIPF